jgi:putative FmdB family regulatory protein
MPIYEFHCAACEHDSEILVRSSDWRGTACPQCGSKKLTKKFSVFAATAAGGGESGPCESGPCEGGGGGGCCGGHCHGHGD